MCAQDRGVDNVFGLSVFVGEHAEAILQRRGFRRGYVIVIHRGARHVTEPTELSDVDAAGYWHEVLTVARAIEVVYRPLKLNLMMLGNQLPHLHTHIVPRYVDDPDAGGPPIFVDDDPPRDEQELRRDADAVRAALARA